MTAAAGAGTRIRSRVAAVVLERRNGRGGEPSVLLLRRAVEPGAGAWDLPAGYLEPGESFEMAARRETREEAGVDVEQLELIGVYHSPPANAVTAVYRAGLLDGGAEIALDFESSDHAWVPRAQLGGWLPRIAFSSMASALGDWLQGPSR